MLARTTVAAAVADHSEVAKSTFHLTVVVRAVTLVGKSERVPASNNSILISSKWNAWSLLDM